MRWKQILGAALLGALHAATGAAAETEAPAWAPGEELATLSFLATDKVRFEDPLDPAISGSVAVQETSLFLPFAATAAGPATLAAGAWAGWTRLDFAGVPDLGTEDLYGAALTLMAESSATQLWSWHVVLMPGFYGEARLMAQAGLRRRLADTWRLELGAAYDDAFGEPQLFPAGGAVWRPADTFTARLLFPASALHWRPARNLGLSVFLQPAGDRWRDKSDGDNDWVYLIEGWRAGFGLEQRLWKNLWLRLAGGPEFARRYEVKNHGNLELDEEVDDTWFAALSLVAY
jgi:hypothetical protein